MWKAIELRVEGDEKMRQAKVALIKREFEAFSHIGNESLTETIERFYHLMTEMANYKIVNTANELVKRFTDGLPAKWCSYVEVLIETDKFDNLNIHEFIQKLQSKENDEQRRATRLPQPQNPNYIMVATRQSHKLDS